MIIWYSIPCSV